MSRLKHNDYSSNDGHLCLLMTPHVPGITVSALPILFHGIKMLVCSALWMTVVKLGSSNLLVIGPLSQLFNSTNIAENMSRCDNVSKCFIYENKRDLVHGLQLGPY